MSTPALIQVEHAPVPTTIVQPRRAFWDLELRDLWEYRELLYFLVWRDVKVRYKQTALGVAWAVLQPLMATLIFSIFFARLARIPSDGVPYPVFAYVAMVAWQYFANALTESSNSLVASQNVIKKVYFPRLIIPLGSVIAGLVDFCFAFIVLIGMMYHYGIGGGWGRLMCGSSINLPWYSRHPVPPPLSLPVLQFPPPESRSAQHIFICNRF
ncbi:MAG TPA: hypothetical protein VF783_16435 [Terriglobales bacterium]